MSEKKHDLKVGDSVVVKPGVKDPDTGGDIGGWQGRIFDPGEDNDETVVGIAWDSITLKNMPFSAIEYSEDEGLDWRVMYLDISGIEPAKARDSERDVERALAEIDKRTHWLGPDEEDKRIQAVLDGLDPDDEMALVEAWEEHLEEKLSFPFEAEVAEYQERGPLRTGDRVKVKSIVDADDHYGIIVKVGRGEERFAFPLCDLEVTDRQSANYQVVKDYVIWFANR
ncbi:MAG: calcium-binding protein [Blastocatellia bacterium]